MAALGIVREDERLELIGGELVPMSPKGVRHETVKRLILRAWRQAPPAAGDILFETTLRINDDTYLEPDLLLVPPSAPLKGLAGPLILLAIEVADTSLGYDLGRKPAIYSRFGVAELWVIDAVRRETHVFTGPTATGYARQSVHPAQHRLVPTLAQDLPLRLDDFAVDWDAGDIV